MPVVTYHGKQDMESMKELYRSMDIFAMLSYPETFGLVYVEAMSQGLPVIYTKGEGFDNFFPNKEIGMSVDHKSQTVFNQAVDYIRQNYAQMSQQAMEQMQRFKWDKINQEYLNLYQLITKESINE